MIYMNKNVLSVLSCNDSIDSMIYYLKPYEGCKRKEREV